MATRPPRMMKMTGGRWEAWCGRCLQTKIVEAPDATAAFELIRPIGWTLYQPTQYGEPYPVCPKCSTAPETTPRPPSRKARRR